MKRGLKVTGPRGVGKSITTWLWACNQVFSRNKTVLWVHVDRQYQYSVVKLSKTCCQEITLSHDQAIEYTRMDDSDIVVLDGVTREVGLTQLITSLFWQVANPNRLSVSVASVSPKINFETDTHQNVHLFKSTPWSREDCHAAIGDDVFFKRVEEFLVFSGDDFFKREEEFLVFSGDDFGLFAEAKSEIIK